MATVIDFPASRRESAAPAQRDERLAWICRFNPPKQSKGNPRNRYDAAFKGHMARRAGELCWALEDAISSYQWMPLNEGERKARIQWVMGQIKAIRDEVLRTTKEAPPLADILVELRHEMRALKQQLDAQEGA